MVDWWANEPLEKRPGWAQAYPRRLAWEMAELNSRGQVVAVSKEEWCLGKLHLTYEWHHDGKVYSLGIHYPPTFPRVRPSIYLDLTNAELPARHCDPTSGRLCYLGHAPHEWKPSHSVARLIDEQLPLILNGAYDDIEEEVGEPAEAWFNAYSPENSCAFVQTQWTTGDGVSGLVRARHNFQSSPHASIRMVVQEVLDDKGKALAKWDGAVPAEFLQNPLIEFPWMRSGLDLSPSKAADIHREYRAKLGSRLQTRKLASGVYGYLFAVIHPTEIKYHETGESWVIFIATGSKRDFEAGQYTKPKLATVRVLRAGPEDLVSRAPQAEVLRNKNIVVAGLGAIGAPVALDLARNGTARLGMIDFDHVSPGNSVRWPLGQPSWGTKKTSALANFIRSNYPACDVHALPLDIAEVLGARTRSSRDMEALLSGTDIVVEATTEFGVLAALYDFCAARRTPIVSVNATPSVAGGAVTVYRPGRGCPTCLLHHYADQENVIEPPPGEADRTSLVHIPGCADVTFTGTSFDLAELSQQAVRVVISALSQDEGKSSLIATLSYSEDEGVRHPSWRVQLFDKHAGCSCT